MAAKKATPMVKKRTTMLDPNSSEKYRLIKMKYNEVKMMDAKNSANAFNSMVLVFALLFETFLAIVPIAHYTTL